MAKVSIIVPCYNQAQYLPETLQSVLDQSFADWECIIVNDGSPDNTNLIAEEWCLRDSRFKYIEKENDGLSAARNTGISAANGEWILPLDSDDKIAPEYLQYAISTISQNPSIGIIYANAMYFGEKDGIWDLPEYNFKDLLKANMIYCSALYRRSDWIETGGYDTNLKHGWEDWEFWINMLSKKQKEVVRLSYIGFFYRVKKASMIQTLGKDLEKKQLINSYVHKKHIDTYIKEFGTYQQILELNEWLANNNQNLEREINNYNSLFIIRLSKKISSIYKRLFQ